MRTVVAIFQRPKRLPALLAAVIFLLHLPVIISHENYLLSWFNIDDGYYYFVVARNLAAGKGFTFDGIAVSNGFHPLWLFVITPIFALPGKILPLRILAALLALLSVATALALYRLTEARFSRAVAFLTALAFALLPPIHNFSVRGGMEAGLSVLAIALLLLKLPQTGVLDRAALFRLSMLASLAFLARLDNIFLVGFVGAWLLLRAWVGEGGLRARWLRFRAPLLLYFGPLLVLLAIYLVWNLAAFGTPTPVSGQVKRWWGTLPNTVYGFPPKRLTNYVGQILTDDTSIGPFSLATAPLYRAAEWLADTDAGPRRLALAGLAAGLVLVLTWLVRKDRDFFRQAAVDLGVLPLFLGCVFQIGYYKFGGSVAQRPWYWIGEMLLVVLVSGMILEALRRTLSGQIADRRMQIAQAGLGLLLAGLLIRPHLPRIDRIFSPEIAGQESYYLRRATWLEAHTRVGARIGMTGSGSSAYFSDDRIFINLDGLISSYAYFQSLQDGTAAAYLEGAGMDYVFGNEYIIMVSDPYGDIFGGRLVPAAQFVDGDRILQLWRFQP